MKQFPLHNASFTGENVLSNSGEFVSQITDVIITGRNLHFRLVRNYRSFQTEQIGYFGRGWTFNYARKITKYEKGLLYFDGEGRSFEFINNLDGSYTSPLGMYCELTVDTNQIIQKFRYGTNQVFELPENGGRILQIIDRNNNTLNFTYTKTQIIVKDTFNRKMVFSITKGLIAKLVDFTGRNWKFSYDKNQCLIEVKQPATRDFPNGTSLKYKYDGLFRLSTLLNARGNTILKNYYDNLNGRVIAQDHGNGSYNFKYTEVGNTSGNIVLSTQTTLKNGGSLTQLHNENGNEVQRILLVSANVIAPEENATSTDGFVDITTLSDYNKHGELTKRVFPSGNSSEWIYSDDSPSPKNQGNLIHIKSISSNNTDKILITSYQYSADFQLLVGETNPKGLTDSYTYDDKGNLIKKIFAKVTIQPIDLASNINREKPVLKQLFETFEYNKFGQLIKKINTDGAITLHCYYTEKDPLGKTKTDSQNTTYQGGLLSSIIKDAKGLKQSNGFKYDIYGNTSILIDGKGNEFTQQFNAMGKIETIIGRKPEANVIEYHFDEDYNVISETKTFQHNVFDGVIQQQKLMTSKSIATYDYNVLNNLTSRVFGSDDKKITEKYILDANENIVQLIQPMGNVTQYKYDERNLMVEKILGVGGSQPASYKFSYTKSGQLKRYTDPLSNNTIYYYDGYQREVGRANPVGAIEKKFLDENGNIQKIQTLGYADDSGTSMLRRQLLLEEKTFYIDEWNRTYKVDEKWIDAKTGKSLGKSSWDGKDGIITSYITYGDNNLPVFIWQEGDNVLSLSYDGLGRSTSIKNAMGQKIQFEYDANNNLIKRVESGNEGNATIEINKQYDELDRLISQKRKGGNPKSWKYNALNQVVQTVEKSGIEVLYYHDSLGRANGKSYKAGSGSGDTQLIMRNQAYNDNFYLTSYTSANGQDTTYQYDDKGRLIAKNNGNGESFKYGYDEKSNLVSVITPENKKIDSTYDSVGRLKNRTFIGQDNKAESFNYDSKNRLVATNSDTAKLSWEYDSLSRVIKQSQNEQTVAYTYNNAGNISSITYPSGKNLQYVYDALGRVVSIIDNQLLTIATYQYNALGKFDNISYYNGIKALFRYDIQHRLETITFNDTATNTIVDGYRYGYDTADRLIYKMPLFQGIEKGIRYFYDNANRIIKVQYDVENALDVNSPFKEQVWVNYSPEGLWSNKMTLDDKGNVLKSEIGTINQSNNYKSLGATAYIYNREGNCIVEFRCKEGTDLSMLNEVTETAIRNLIVDFTYWTYEFDEHNRLRKAVEHDKDGNILQTIEYFYDSIGHLIARTETDRNGTKTHYTFVYAGDMVIEEYVNGVLTNQNVFGPSFNTPLQINKLENGRWMDIIPSFDGRQNVTALLDGLKKDAKQRFGIDDLGGAHIFQVNGKPISPNNPLASFSNALTTLLGGFGNTVGKGILGSFGKAQSQFTDSRTGMNLFGGNAKNPQTGHTKNPNNFVGGRDMSLYAAGESILVPLLKDVLIGIAGNAAYDAIKGFFLGNNEPKQPNNNDMNGGESARPYWYGLSGGVPNSGSDGGSEPLVSDDEVNAAIDKGLGELLKKQNDKNNEGSNTNNNGAIITTTTTTTVNKDGTVTTTTTTTTKYTTGEYDSGIISSIAIKKAEAKLNSNMTPMNPGFSSFAITPEYFETKEERRKQIELITGEDTSSGVGIPDEVPEPPMFRYTNYGNPYGPGREKPDFSLENLPRGGENSNLLHPLSLP